MSRAGSPGHKQPAQWWRLDSTQELVRICGIEVRQAHLNHTFICGTTGTCVIPNLAVAYAKYLSPRFHAWANQAVIERISGSLVGSKTVSVAPTREMLVVDRNFLHNADASFFERIGF